MKNFYEVLRVRTNATTAQIKKSFITLVSKYHPDIYKGDKSYAERYTAILTEAYATLRDENRRKEYDLKHNIDSTLNLFQTIQQDREINKTNTLERKAPRKNLEQELSRKYFKNTERKKSHFFRKLFKSKLFYSVLFLLAVEAFVIYIIFR